MIVERLRKNVRVVLITEIYSKKAHRNVKIYEFVQVVYT